MKRTSQEEIEDAIRRNRVQQHAASIQEEQQWRNRELQNALANNQSIARNLAFAELAAAAVRREAAVQSARHQLASVVARQRQAESILRQCQQEQQETEALLNLLQPSNSHIPTNTNAPSSQLSNSMFSLPPTPAKLGVPPALSNVRTGSLVATTGSAVPPTPKEMGFGSETVQCMYNGSLAAPSNVAYTVASLSGLIGDLPTTTTSDFYSKLLAATNSNQISGQDLLGMGNSSILSGAQGSSRPSVLAQENRLDTKPPARKHKKKLGASATEVWHFDPGKVKELALPSDKGNLSEYQCLLREQILLFEVSINDIQCSAQGRNKPIKLGQVGVLCRYCANIPPGMRPCGAAYFPAKLSGLYQASQNMAINHFTKSCRSIPEETRERLIRVKEQKSTVLGGGKQFWANGARVTGVIEDEDSRLRFKEE